MPQRPTVCLLSFVHATVFVLETVALAPPLPMVDDAPTGRFALIVEREALPPITRLARPTKLTLRPLAETERKSKQGIADFEVL